MPVPYYQPIPERKELKVPTIHRVYQHLQPSSEACPGQTPETIAKELQIEILSVYRMLRKLHALGLAAAHRQPQPDKAGGRPNSLWYRIG